MLSGSLSGFGHFMRGFSLITKPGVRPYVIIPLLINVLLFSAMIWFGSDYLSGWVESLLPSWLQIEWLRSLIWGLFAISLLLVSSYIFILFANLVAAPFNALLSEQVEFHLTGQRPPSEGQNILALIIESVVGEIKKIIYILLRMLPILLLFLIPGINIIAPFVWFIFSAWMLTLEYADYPMGNHDIGFPQQRERLKKQRLMSLSFGSSALFFTTMPFINLIAMPVSVAGATSLFVARLRNTQA